MPRRKTRPCPANEWASCAEPSALAAGVVLVRSFGHNPTLARTAHSDGTVPRLDVSIACGCLEADFISVGLPAKERAAERDRLKHQGSVLDA